MKISKSYKLSEFLGWTRRKLYIVLALAIIPAVVYQLLGQKWVALPWPLAVLLGTAASFIVGFKNAQTYNRTVEAQQVWTAIASASRYWGTISRDFPTNPRSTKVLIHRHLAWLTVLRYELRGPPGLGKRDQQLERRIPGQVLHRSGGRKPAGGRTRQTPARGRARAAISNEEQGHPAHKRAKHYDQGSVRKPGAGSASPH